MKIRISAIYFALFFAALLSAQSPLPKPAVLDNGVVNGASFVAGPVAPGSIVSIFGNNLGMQLVNGATTPISEVATTIPLGTSLGGHSVVFTNGSAEFAAPLFFLTGQGSPNQINAQVPWELAGQQNTQMIVKVTNDGNGGTTQSDAYPMTVGAASPALFSFDFGPGRAIAVNVKVDAGDDVINGSLAQPAGGNLPNAQPAPQGGYIILYANGLGPVDPPALTGRNSLDALRTATEKPVVMVGDKPADVQFAGLAPEFVGVYQVNVLLPADATVGDTVPIRITQGGVTSRDGTTIAIRAKP